MSTQEFWKVLQKFYLLFKNRVQFPYTFSLKTQEVIMLDLSRNQKLKLTSSSVFLLANTVYCFFILCYNLRKTSKQLKIEQLLLISLQFFLSACFMAIHFVISFRCEVPVLVLNAMARLDRRIQCIICIYYTVNTFTISTVFIIPRFRSLWKSTGL